jgi:hypothetical protein
VYLRIRNAPNELRQAGAGEGQQEPGIDAGAVGTSANDKAGAVVAQCIKEAQDDAAGDFREEARDKRRWDRLREFAGAISPAVIQGKSEVLR